MREMTLEKIMAYLGEPRSREDMGNLLDQGYTDNSLVGPPCFMCAMV